MRRFKFIGTEQDAREYGGNIPVIGKVYSEDVIMGSNTSVLEWAKNTGEGFDREWQEVFEEDSSQQAYCSGEKDYMSVSIVTYNGEKEITINFSTNDLEILKKFVNNLSC